MSKDFYENIISKEFCARDTLEVTPELLGAYLHHRLEDGTIVSGKIVEVEAYKQNDPACHAFKGCTPRSSTLFGPPATAYVYFIYGMYHCFNVVAEPENTAGAILVRALEPVPPLENTHGPGRLCKAMKIDKNLNQTDLTDSTCGLWITLGKPLSKSKIVQTTRIGIKLAADFKWRYYIKDNRYVSVK